MSINTTLLVHFGLTWWQLVLIFALVFLLIRVIQRITRKKNPEEQALLDAWHKDPANWKAGVFYFNPKDDRIFPPKRISGLGWTINFANPVSVVTFVCIILIVIALAASQS